jgi:hypothetical protein
MTISNNQLVPSSFKSSFIREDEADANGTEDKSQVTSSVAPQEDNISNETTQATETPETEDKSTEVTPTDKEEQKLNAEDENWKQRYADLRTHLNDKTNELKELKSRIKELESKPDLSKLASEEDLAEFEKDNPEVYAVFKTIALKTNKELEEKLQLITQQQTLAEQEKAFAEILKVHPDADQIRKSDEFKEWYSHQTRAIQWLISSDTPADAIKGLHLYKDDKGLSKKAVITEKKQEKAQAAAAVSSSSTKGVSSDTRKIWKESDIERMNASEYASHKDDINKATREGRVIYDLSGSR